MKNHLSPVSYTLPSYWASYLINGDASGISPEDKAACDAWHKARNLPAPVSCGDRDRDPVSGASGEAWFARSNDAGTLAGDVLDFTYLLPGRDASDPEDPSETSLAYREAHEREQDDTPRADTADDLS